MRRELALLLLLVSFWPAPTGAVITGDEETDKALPKLACICGGCPRISVDQCLCGTAEEMASEALQLARQGNDAEAIVASFVDQYGAQVLSAPPAKGFDLVLWLGPFAALILGSAGVFFYVRARGRAHAESATSPPAGTDPTLEGFDPFS